MSDADTPTKVYNAVMAKKYKEASTQLDKLHQSFYHNEKLRSTLSLLVALGDPPADAVAAGIKATLEDWGVTPTGSVRMNEIENSDDKHSRRGQTLNGARSEGSTNGPPASSAKKASDEDDHESILTVRTFGISGF